MSFGAAKNRHTHARFNIPHPESVVLGGRQQDEAPLRVKLEIVYGASVAEKRIFIDWLQRYDGSNDSYIDFFCVNKLKYLLFYSELKLPFMPAMAKSGSFVLGSVVQAQV